MCDNLLMSTFNSQWLRKTLNTRCRTSWTSQLSRFSDISVSWYVPLVNICMNTNNKTLTFPKPGAFSAYRYIALQNNKQGVGPLASYFKGEVLHGRDTDIFTSNMCRTLLSYSLLDTN